MSIHDKEYTNIDYDLKLLGGKTAEDNLMV